MDEQKKWEEQAAKARTEEQKRWEEEVSKAQTERKNVRKKQRR